MRLWEMDLVGGVPLADGRGCKMVTRHRRPVPVRQLPDPEVYEPVDWIGVYRGIVNLATTSDGTNCQGRRLPR